MNRRRRAADIVQHDGPKGVARVQFGCKRGCFSSGNRPCSAEAERRNTCVEAFSEAPDGVQILN